MFEVHLKTLDGDSKNFQIEDDDLTVAAFKQRITEKMDIPIERQRLIFQGKVLVDDKKLKDCGVASNTIHLVPRPPPQPNANSASSSSSSQSAPQEHQNISFGAPNFLSLRQTMNSLLSATPGFHSGNTLSMQTDNSGNINIEVNIPIGETCNNHFRQLQQQAIQLLNALDGVIPSDSTTTSASANAENPAVDIASENAPSTSTSTSQQTTSLTFQRLADMLVEQRQLWHRLEPHMDRWERMLRYEHDFRPKTSESEGSQQVTTDATVDETACAASAITESITTEQEPMDTSDSTANVTWSQEVFNQVSALLHLHAHMLHLLSDFYILSTDPSMNQSTTGGTVGTSTSSPSPLESEAQGSTSMRESSRQTRSLVINEPDSSVLFAEINIEPTLVTVARPVVSVSQGETNEVRESQSVTSATSVGVPATGETATGVRLETDSQGASLNIPTAVVIETPVGRTAQAAILDHLIDSMTPRIRSRPQTQQEPGEEQVEASRGPSPRVLSTPSLGSPRRPTAPLFTGLVPRHSYHFLPCNSHHFGNTGSGAIHLPTRRRRSYIDPAASIRGATPRRRSHGAVSRRDRSAGAQTGSNSARTASPSTTSGSAPRVNPPYHNLLRSVASAISSDGVNSEVFSRAIGDVTSHLTQMVAQGVGSDFGAASASATTGSTTMGPFTWIINNSPNFGVQLIPPPHFVFPGGNTTANSTLSEPGARLTTLPGLLIEGLIRSMWSFIFELAQVQLPSESMPNVDLDGWRSGSNFPFINHSDDLSRIRPVMMSLVHSLHIATSEAEEDGSNSVVRRAVDLMNPHLQRLLERNIESQSCTVRRELVDLLLNNFFSDEVVDTIPESDFVAWGTSRAASLGVAPQNIRWSLHNFLTDSLSRQLPLWRDTGSQGVLGTIILNSLNAVMLDLLGLCSLIVQRMVGCLGLQPEPSNPPGSSETSIANLDHIAFFEPMTSMLRDFANSIRGNDREREAANLILRGVDAVLREYAINGAARLAENRERLEPYLATKNDAAEDSDVSEVYMDASEESPTIFPTAATATSSAKVTEGISSAALPEWRAESTSLPTAPLAPNPQSNWRAPSDDCTPLLPSAPESFPREWTALVASDVNQMSATSAPTIAGSREEPVEATSGEEDTSSVRRLSDAYIAGMPSKRRRVMLEKKQSLVCPVNHLFMDLLKEAMLLTSLAGPAVTEASTEGDSVETELRQPPQHVSEAFRTYVCDQLSHRLSTDPDFDAQRHLAAKKAFGKQFLDGK